MFKRTILVGIILALASAAFADWPCAAENTTVYKIDAAEKAGAISADEALMYKYMALYERYMDDIPAAYRGEWYSPEHWACGTPVVMDLWRRWPHMDPTVKTRLQEECGLGDTQQDMFALRRRCSWGDSGYGGSHVYTYDTPEGNFRVHYVLDGPNAITDPSDPNNNGIPDNIEKLGADLERAFAQYVQDKWYYHPDPEDQKYFPLKDKYEDPSWPAEGNDFGGNDRWDGYCGLLSAGVGGVAFADQAFPYTERDDYSGYMNFRSSYTEGSGGSFGEPVITAHEFMHVTQFMIDVGTPSWYLEASAMWSEDTVYPNAADPRGRMTSYLSNTLHSLNNTDDGGYIACIINFFFRDYCWRDWRLPEWREIEGYLTPREVWRALAKGDQWYTDNPSVNRGDFDGFDFIISYYHVGKKYVEGRAFTDAFNTWNEWNWFTGLLRNDGKHYRWDYGGVGLQNRWGSGEYPILNFEPPPTYYMNNWGHGYYYFTGLPNWPAAVFKFEGDPDNAEQSKDWGGMVLVSKNGTTWTNLAGKQGESSRMCSPVDKGIIQVRNPSQYDAVVMIINNTASIGQSLPFKYSCYSTDHTTAPTLKAAIARPQANPDYVELLIGSDEDLFGAPEADVYFTPNKGEARAAAVEMSGSKKAFIGSFVMDVGENGSGRFNWTCADEAGNIVNGSKDFGAGYLALGGGTVGSGGAVLKVPGGAIGKATLFTVVAGDEEAASSVAASVPESGGQVFETVGRTYEVGPNWATLARPVQVTLSYDGLNVAREEYLSVYRWNGTAWEDLGGTIDKRARRVTAVAGNLGKFVLGYGEKKGSTPPRKPVAFGLYQNYPNPARDNTVITYSLPEASDVALAVFDLSGRRVATVVDEFKAAGVFKFEYALTDDSGRPLPAGVYVYRLTAGADTATRKMVVTR